MTDTPAPPLGFIGLGLMGEPMALNLARAGTPLVVWNRSPAGAAAVVAAGARQAPTVEALFAEAPVVLLMLADAAAVDAVLGRGTPRLATLVRGRTVVHMGTTAPDYSLALHDAVRAAGGRYVEAPVSGSRVPAQRGALVAMVAGDPEAVAALTPRLAPVARAVIPCGAAPNATLMKLAVNTYLNAMFAALAEARHFAGRAGLDLDAFQQALLAGPLASDVVRVKVPRLVARDFGAPQTAVGDVYVNTRLIIDTARRLGAAVPMTAACSALYGAPAALGDGGREDVAAVLRAFEALAGPAPDG